MEKQVNIKGFTFAEMLLVLSFISCMVLIVPCRNFLNAGNEKYDFAYLKERLILEQHHALDRKKMITVEILNDGINVDDKNVYTFHPSFTCDETKVIFHENGNVNKAQTIHCYGRKSYELAVSLGSGRIYEK